MQIFYTPDINSDIYTLSEEESKHSIRVLRLTTGSTVRLIDGKGGLYAAEIIDDNPRKCEIKVISRQLDYEKSSYYLHVAIAPTKNIDRFEWFLEKATEIGIDEITPIISERSERKEVKNDRLEKVIIAAMKQSIKAYCPVLNPAVPYKDFIKKNHSGQLYIAHCEEGEKAPLKDVCVPGSNVLVMIGPEGDFSSTEISRAVASGFKEVSLGKARLRTETAGILVCAAVNLLNQ